MSDKSSIEWTDATWNPVTGCNKVSPGCKHCYAETFAERWRGIPGHPYEQGFDLRLWPERLEIPLKWKRPRVIFVNSMSDLFHEDVPFNFIAQVFLVMAKTPHHTYQVLTKRAERMSEYVNSYCPFPLPNVWLGVSVENQEYANERIPHLLETPAAVRFLSCEPLLGPVHFGYHLPDWVIVGGESGPGARPMDPQWARDIRDLCERTGVPFFFKQWGGVHKKSAGRLLDGKTHDATPHSTLTQDPKTNKRGG